VAECLSGWARSAAVVDRGDGWRWAERLVPWRRGIRLASVVASSRTCIDDAGGAGWPVRTTRVGAHPVSSSVIRRPRPAGRQLREVSSVIDELRTRLVPAGGLYASGASRGWPVRVLNL